jgi:hypothetical protein
MMEPLAAVSKKQERSEDALFLRLQDVAAAHREVYGCAVQGADCEFIVFFADAESGKALCAWSGSSDAVILEFQHWLERKHVGALESGYVSDRSPSGFAKENSYVVHDDLHVRAGAAE